MSQATEPDDPSDRDAKAADDQNMAAPKRFFRESQHPLAEMYRKRVRQNRDLVVLITDSSNDRGTGKTTEAIRLAYGMDRTDEGLTTEKATIDPYPLLQAYTEQPPTSGLVLDESEDGLDKYRAGSAVNSAIRKLVSMGRVEQKYLVLNAPSDKLVDNDLKSLVDVWILVERRGFAKVHRMDWNPYAGKELTPEMGTIEWDPIPSSHEVQQVYDYLDKQKRSRLRGEGEDSHIKTSEAEEMVEQAKKETRRDVRDEYIVAMAEETGLTQAEIGDVVDLGQSSVSQILADNA